MRIALLMRVDPGDEVVARATIYQQTDKNYSLTDAISFAIMARLGIRQAWALDKHFAPARLAGVDAVSGNKKTDTLNCSQCVGF